MKQTPQKPKQPKRTTPIVGTEQVKCLCGHMAEFGLFADKTDIHRERRRKKLTDRNCPDCRQKAHIAKLAEERANAIKRRERKNVERLPDGAVFHVQYDAAAVMWTGTLTIQGTTFTDSSPGVFRLLRALDGKYRDALALVMAAENSGSA